MVPSTTVSSKDESNTQSYAMTTILLVCSVVVIILINVIFCVVWNKMKKRRNPQVNRKLTL